jgi:hypothetical protein
MKRRKFLAILSILVALILALVAIVPASAGTPVHTKSVWSDDYTENICGVPMDVHHEGKLEYIIYCNKDGECRGDSYHFNDYFTYTYEGRSFTVHYATGELYSWPGGEQSICRISGAKWIGTLPGHGVVWGEATRDVWWELCPYEGCERVTLHWSGMVFYNPEPICDYMLNGE